MTEARIQQTPSPVEILATAILRKPVRWDGLVRVTTEAHDPYHPASAAPPPSYILAVDAPAEDSLPSYAGPSCSYVQSRPGVGALPVYEETTQVEPQTLARSLWKWGFLCPLLWILGCLILCIPLRALDDEEDAMNKQKMDEMIAILRETELKYARRCAISVAAFLSVVVLIVVIIVVVLTTRR